MPNLSSRQPKPTKSRIGKLRNGFRDLIGCQAHRLFNRAESLRYVGLPSCIEIVHRLPAAHSLRRNLDKPSCHAHYMACRAAIFTLRFQTDPLPPFSFACAGAR